MENYEDELLHALECYYRLWLPDRKDELERDLAFNDLMYLCKEYFDEQ